MSSKPLCRHLTTPLGASTTEYLVGLSLFSLIAWAGLTDDWMSAIRALWHHSLFLISSPTI
jgi:hypothetical protein